MSIEVTANLQQALPIITSIIAGPPGAQGPPGEDGADIVAVPYDDWPPASPASNTLYLRLMPE